MTIESLERPRLKDLKIVNQSEIIKKAEEKDDKK